MIIKDNIKKAIIDEYNSFKESMYAGKTIEQRKQLDQFFTPSEITIQMIEKFDCESLEGKTILDPTSGSGNLLAACLIAGADADKVFGNDYDPVMVELCRERLAEFGVPRNNIHQGNALHSFCITKELFGDDYDSNYFRRANASKKIDSKF